MHPSCLFLEMLSDIVSCIQIRTTTDNFKVTVVSGCPSGTSDIADNLSLRYLLTCINSKAAAVCISGLGTIRMVDQNVVSITVGPACISDCSGFCSPDGSSSRSCNISTSMTAVTPDRAGNITGQI